MSGADISEILRRALEAKVHQTTPAGHAPPVTSADLLVAIDGYKRGAERRGEDPLRPVSLAGDDLVARRSGSATRKRTA